MVDWIIVNPNDSNDYIAHRIDLTSPAFTSQFSFILQEPNGLTLYHRNGLPPLPWHAVSRSVFTEHHLCGIYNAGQFSNVPIVPASAIAVKQQPVPRQEER